MSDEQKTEQPTPAEQAKASHAAAPSTDEMRPRTAMNRGPTPQGVPTAPNKEIQERMDKAALSTRRVRFLIVNPTDFLMLFQKGLVLAKRTEIVQGVPEDAKIISMTVDHVRGGIILVVESNEYDEIPRTQMPPVQEVSIKIGVENATKKVKKRKK